MRHRSDPDGAKHGNAFDGTSVLIAGGAPPERRKASSPPLSPVTRLVHPESRHADLNQQQYNSIHRSAVTSSPVVPQQRDHDLHHHAPNPNPSNKITKDPAQSQKKAALARAPALPSPSSSPQLPQYNNNKNDRTGNGLNLVDLDVTILADDSLMEPHSVLTGSTGGYASTTQPHRNGANDPQPRSPSSSSSNNNRNNNTNAVASAPPPPRPAHNLNFKDQARSVGSISAEGVVVAPPDHGAYDRLGASRGSDSTFETYANHHPRPTVIAKARLTSRPPSPPNDRLRPQQQSASSPTGTTTSSSSYNHPHRTSTSYPSPRNDSTPAPPPLPRRQPSYHTPEETVFSFAVPKQQTGCGCVIQ